MSQHWKRALLGATDNTLAACPSMELASRRYKNKNTPENVGCNYLETLPKEQIVLSRQYICTVTDQGRLKNLKHPTSR